MINDGLPAMDDEVVRAMARWPNVPQCFGWLGLDRRGGWRIKGELIAHQRARDFLARHYRSDEYGRWYVQNGPQQVFVELEYTPWIYRRDAAAGFVTHTGVAVRDISAALTDDDGNLLLVGTLGIGLVDDRDLAVVGDWIEDNADGESVLVLADRAFVLNPVMRARVAADYGFEPHPQPL